MNTNVRVNTPTNAEDTSGLLPILYPNFRPGVLALEHIRQNDLLQGLKHCGAVLLRGFDSEIGSFSGLVERVSTRVSLDPARTFTGRVAQKVDAGTDAVGLHLENGNSPFNSDYAWFFCEEAPRLGSRTTVCDGTRVWKALPQVTRERFLKSPIEYSRRVPEERWKILVMHALKYSSMEIVTFSDLESLCAGSETELILHEDESISYRYRTPAMAVTANGDMTFANSILGPSYNYEKPVIRFCDNGEIIDRDLLRQLSVVMESVTQDVPWEDGDILLIDNRRTMHGRRRIEDIRRTIYNALSDF